MTGVPSSSHPKQYTTIAGNCPICNAQTAQFLKDLNPPDPKNRCAGYILLFLSIIAAIAIGLGIACAAGAPHITQALLRKEAWIPLIACGSGIAMISLIVTSVRLLSRYRVELRNYNFLHDKIDEAKQAHPHHKQASGR